MELTGQANIQGEENHLSDEKANMGGAPDVSSAAVCRSVLSSAAITHLSLHKCSKRLPTNTYIA